MNERTFVAVKPDGVQRKQLGAILRRFEKKGFKLVGLKLMQVLRPSIGHGRTTESINNKVAFLTFVTQNVSPVFSGLRGPPQRTLLGPEEQAFLRRTHPLHELRPCRRNGKILEIRQYFPSCEVLCCSP